MAEPAAWLRGWRTGSRGTTADRWCSDLFQFSLNQLRSRALTFLNLETNVTVDLRVFTDCTPNVRRPGGGGLYGRLDLRPPASAAGARRERPTAVCWLAAVGVAAEGSRWSVPRWHINVVPKCN